MPILSTRPLIAAAAFALPAVASASPETPAQSLTRADRPSTRDVSDPDTRAMYAVGYAHLDTQWRWDFVTTIDRFILDTLEQNFDRIDNHPGFVFSFTGSVRYEMMEEYYPELFKRLREEIDNKTWYVSGSSVDEGDVNVPSPESIIRQVLYGNLYFEREFGVTSADFMLPDCFGFPWSMPSIWAHCGVVGFSTQKLSWGSAVGIPFNVGVWNGPDGNGVIAALNPGAYATAIRDVAPDAHPNWDTRINANGNEYGIWADYHYYGVGDVGGAPKESDVIAYTEAQSRNGTDEDGRYDLRLVSSDQLFVDITPEQRAQLPTYSGDMLLTEHSAGTLTSQSSMKRWMRQSERLAQAAESAAVTADWLGENDYPRDTLERAWVRILANQMHDILPGTSLPRAYTYSWNDMIVGMNLFADVLEDSAGRVARHLDTNVVGHPLVVFNALSFDRADLVEATVPIANPGFRIVAPDGTTVPHQVLDSDAQTATVLFRAQVPANGYAVYDVQPSMFTPGANEALSVSPVTLENERYKVTINAAGDIASIHDKQLDRELLDAPAGLVFTYERPQQYPAWNMDWADRQRPPIDRVAGPVSVRIVEDGPVRVALAITRHARNSTITQTISLAQGSDLVEIDCDIDWQSTEVALKASFPLSASNPNATYNWGLGTIERTNNERVKYEVPSHEWLDLTDTSGDFGVTILEDSKFGSDKPTDNEVRLTLLYTPGVRGAYVDQHSQDWGRHAIRYAIKGHADDWRESGSQDSGRRFNQPLRAFNTIKHDGRLGRTFSFAKSDTPNVHIRALKGNDRDIKGNESNSFIVRVREMHGVDTTNARLTFAHDVESVTEVDGQERVIDTDTPPTISGNAIGFGLTPYLTRAFRVTLKNPDHPARHASAQRVSLPYNADVSSFNAEPHEGFPLDAHARSLPAEMLPETLTHAGVGFRLANPRNDANALIARGQTLKLPGKGDTVHILATATTDIETAFGLGSPQHTQVPSWTGFVGQWDDRVFDQQHQEIDFSCEGEVIAITPGFIKRQDIAWFATHRHHQGEDEAYRFSYLYHLKLDRGNADTITLPYDERLVILAMTVADAPKTAAAHPLYDTLDDHTPIEIRHDYDTLGYGSPDSAGPKLPSTAGLQPAGHVTTDRGRLFEHLIMGAPSGTDDAQTNGTVFRFIDPSGEHQPHPSSGAAGDTLPRLSDGLLPRNNDDTARNVWFDQGGRFIADLGASRLIASIRTYSWHRSDRSPQWFQLWGSNASTMPDASGEGLAESGWTYIATVDTRELGEGRPHGSDVAPKDGTDALGPFRHLLWIAPPKGSATFFSEIDIDFAE